VIPVVLTVPMDRYRAPSGRHRLLWWLGALLALAGVAGSVIWVMAFSPVSFERFQAEDGARSLRLDGPAEYVVFEERLGTSPPPLPVIVVQDLNGDRIVASLPDRGSPRPVARSLPFFAAWEVGRFEVPADGIYSLYAVRPSPSDPRPAGTLAVASARSATWLGSWVGLVAFGGIPLVAGAACMGLARRLGRQPKPGAVGVIR
jgi:hypothetical protein